MTTPLWNNARVQRAAAFAGLCAVVLGSTLAAAVRDEPVAQLPPYTPPAVVVQPAARDVRAFAALAALTPFGDETGAPDLDDVGPPSPRCVGTIVGGDRPSAVCSLPGATSRILHLSDTLGGWRLTRVTPGHVIFIDIVSPRRELRLSFTGN